MVAASLGAWEALSHPLSPMDTIHEIDGRYVVAIPFSRGGFLTPGRDGEAYFGRSPDLKMGFHYSHKRDAIKRARQLFPEDSHA